MTNKGESGFGKASDRVKAKDHVPSADFLGRSNLGEWEWNTQALQRAGPVRFPMSPIYGWNVWLELNPKTVYKLFTIRGFG